MPRWSEQAKVNSAALKIQKRDHAHDEKMAILTWLSANEENVLILGAIGGMGTSYLGILLNPTDKKAKPGEAVPDIVAAARKAANPFSSTISDEHKDGGGTQTDLLNMVSGTVSSMGTSVAAMCMGLLILKNIGPALQGIGEMIPG